jgi:hypothetical protein
MRSMVEGVRLKLSGWGWPPPPRTAVPLPQRGRRDLSAPYRLRPASKGRA